MRAIKLRQAAWLDRWQSLSGALLAGFIFIHLHLESSILFGKDAFYQVARMLEAGFLDPSGHGYPSVIVLFGLVLFAVLLAHAIAALRRFPHRFIEWRKLQEFSKTVPQRETNLWIIQLFTGFALFFLVPVHLLGIIMNPGSIDPNLSAYRIVEQGFGFLYLILLPTVVIHAFIGVYRLGMKWFGDKLDRFKLQKGALAVSGWLILLGTVSLIVWFYNGFNLSEPLIPYSPL